MRDSFELLDALSSLGVLMESDVLDPKGGVLQEQLEEMLVRLVEEGRVYRLGLGRRVIRLGGSGKCGTPPGSLSGCGVRKPWGT